MAITKATASSIAPAAKGDLVVGSNTNDAAILAVASTAGYLLTVDSGETTGLKWAAPSAPTAQGASVYKNTSQSCTNGVYTTLTFDSEYFDTDGFHSTSTNTGRMTIPTGFGGKYLVICQVYYNPTVNSGPTMKFQVNGNDNRRVVTYVAGGSSLPGTLLNTAFLNLSAGDYVESLFYNDTGAPRNVDTNEYGHFSIIRIGA